MMSVLLNVPVIDSRDLAATLPRVHICWHMCIQWNALCCKILNKLLPIGVCITMLVAFVLLLLSPSKYNPQVMPQYNCAMQPLHKLKVLQCFLAYFFVYLTVSVEMEQRNPT